MLCQIFGVLIASVDVTLIRKTQSLFSDFLFLAGLSILFPCLLLAWDTCPRGYFAIRGELLYFSPSYEETYFVINKSDRDGMGNLTPAGKRIHNPVGYNFGFRLTGLYEFCDPCFDIKLRWTHIYSTNKKIVTNYDHIPQLWPIDINPNQPIIPEPFIGTSTSLIGIMHQKGECLLGEGIGRLHCCHFFLREGIEWSYIRYHEGVEYIVQNGPTQKIEFHAHTKGLGPQFGVLALCEPWTFFSWYPRNLSVKFLTTASFIVANSKAKVKETNDIFDALFKVTQCSFWKLVPEWSLSFGLNYLYSRCSLATSIEIGYEMTTYFRGISKLIFVDRAHPGASFNQYCDFYVHGLYLALSIYF